MKNSKDYGDKLKKWIRSRRQSAQQSTAEVYGDPMEALIFGIISECRTEPEGKKIWKRIQTHFVDFNDLRVCRNEEIFEVMEDHSPQALKTAVLLTGVLNHIYDKYDSMSLAVLKEQGKRQGRKELEELKGITRFAVEYCFLTSLGGHAIPLTESMKDLLRREELIHAESPDDEIAGFMERQIAAAEAWNTYNLIRAASEGRLKEAAVTRNETVKKASRKKAVSKTTISKKKTSLKSAKKK